MTVTEERHMNAQRITISIIFFLLLAACLMQTSLTGCSKNEDKNADTSDANAAADAAFLSRPDTIDSPAATNWQPVGDNILTQVLTMYRGSGLNITALESDTGDKNSMKCTLEYRGDISGEKQILDGFAVFYATFPRMDHYRVELSNGQAWDADYGTLEALNEAGYVVEMSDHDALMVWRMVIGAELPAAQPPGVISVQIED